MAEGETPSRTAAAEKPCVCATAMKAARPSS